MDAQNSFDDCYFYYYSSCTKGDECPFRHSESALGTETVCSLWREGRCFRDNCKFRHMESRIKRSTIPCYWENQPGGCRKPHCVFFHTKYRSGNHTMSENQGLILPVSTQSPTLITNPTSPNVPSEPVKMMNYSAVESSLSTESLTLSPASQPVEPVVVSLDEGEESDAESVSSTPVKSTQSKARTSVLRGTGTAALFHPEEKDFGVKTLEQLRMEKIHRESEHFYKPDDCEDKVIDDKALEGKRISSLHEESNMFCFSDYCVPPHENLQTDMNSASSIYKDFYPTDSSDILPLSNISSQDNMLTSNTAVTQKENLLSIRRDLRSKIKSSLGELMIAQEKRTLSLKRSRETEEDSLDFKIKTLDEIRKEKQKKANEIGHSRSPPPSYEIINEQQTQEIKNESSDTTNRRKVRKLFRDPFTEHKEDREVQKSIEQNLRIDDSVCIRTEQNGSVNGISVEEVDEKNADSTNLKIGEVENNFSLSRESCKEDYPNAIINKTKQDDTNTTQRPNATLKNSTSENISLPRKLLRPIIRVKRKITVEMPVDVTNKEKSVPSNNPQICVNDNSQDKTTRQQESSIDTMSDSDQHISSKKEPSVPDASDVTEKDISSSENSLPELAKNRSSSVDDFDHLFLNDSEMVLEEGDDSDKKAEDIFLEIEQMLDS